MDTPALAQDQHLGILQAPQGKVQRAGQGKVPMAGLQGKDQAGVDLHMVKSHKKVGVGSSLLGHRTEGPGSRHSPVESLT